MGQYSLVNYEKYKTHKIRPPHSLDYPDNWGGKKFTVLSVSWQKIEPKAGCFDLSSVENSLSHLTNPLLHIDLTPPAWATSPLENLHKSVILKLGSLLDNGEFIGVFWDTTQIPVSLADTLLLAFSKTPLIVDLTNHPAQNYLQKQNYPFGLYISCSEKDILVCCEQLARQNLQHNWKFSPIILQLPPDSSKDFFLHEVKKWHIAFSNTSLEIGYKIELRKLAYPKEVSASGALPLRFWFVNTGTAPCYSSISVKLRISNDDEVHEIDLHTAGLFWKTGDIIYNEIARIPAIQSGEYNLSIALFIGKHNVKLANSLDYSDGFYALGKVIVDYQNRDDLFHIWDDYYPEGYYPLEDPQTPNETGQNQSSGGEKW